MAVNLEAEIASLKFNVKQQAARIRLLEKYVDTVSSPLWKRVVFVIAGYRWRRLGVWYRARWNREAWHYDD